MTWRASSGLRAWVIQRLSALYLAACFIALAVGLVQQPLDYESWRGWFSQPVVNIAAAMFFIALVLHAWVGVRDVVIDYVHAAAVRFALLGLIGLILTATLLWALRVLWALPLA